MEYQDFDQRDTCLQISHYVWARSLFFEYDLFYKMATECRILDLLGHRKNPSYRWSNSDGLTKWLYDHITKYINLDPFKGLNSDQYRALFLALYGGYHINKSRICKHIAMNVIIGFVLRAFLTPSLMEHLFAKPQAYILLFKMFKTRYINPLYWISLVCFYFSVKSNLKEPIEKSTTNKISMIPTMYYLGYKLPPMEYIIRVYGTYYHDKPEVAEAMTRALSLCRSKLF